MLSDNPLLEQARQFLVVHFLKIIFLIGISFVAISYWEPYSDVIGGNIYSAFGKTGEMILVGGMFSAIVKSTLFINVIGKELEKIVLSSNLIQWGGSEDAMARFLSLCYKKPLPKLAEKFDNQIVTATFPVGQNWVISSKVISMDVEWSKADSKLVKIDQTMTIRYIAASKDTVVSHHAEYCPMMGNLIDDCNAKFDDILVDNKSIEYEAKEYVKEKSNKKIILELSGKDEYEIVRYSTILIDLDKDPTLFSAAKTYTLHTEVSVNVLDPDIGVFFTEVGVRKPFQDRPNLARRRAGEKPASNQTDQQTVAQQAGVTTNRRHISKVYQDLILPEQGFMLIFARRFEESPDEGSLGVKPTVAG